MDCVANSGWSIAASASSNSQLAGLLAGFVFTGLLVLFSPGPERKLNAQVLSLLATTFVALGFDSYLFGYVSGLVGDTSCGRIWSAGMLASGVLGLGTTSLVCAIAWLVMDYVDDSVQSTRAPSPAFRQRAKYIGRLMTLLPVLVQIPATLLVASTNRSYFEVMGRVTARSSDDDVSLTKILVRVCVGLILVAAALRIWRRARLYRNKKAAPGPSARIGPAYFIGLSLLLLFPMVTPILVGVLSVQNELRGPGVVTFVAIYSVLAPAAITTILVSSVPDFSQVAYSLLAQYTQPRRDLTLRSVGRSSR